MTSLCLRELHEFACWSTAAQGPRASTPLGCSTFCFLLLPFHCLCFSRAPLPASLLHVFVLFLFSPPPLVLVSFWFWLPLKPAELFGDGSPTAPAPQPGPKGARSVAIGEGVRGLVHRGWRGAAVSSLLTVFHWSPASSSILMFLPGFSFKLWDQLVFPVRCGGCIPLCPFLLSCWRQCEVWGNHRAPTVDLALLLLALNLPFIANVPGMGSWVFLWKPVGFLTWKTSSVRDLLRAVLVFIQTPYNFVVSHVCL